MLVRRDVNDPNLVNDGRVGWPAGHAAALLPSAAAAPGIRRCWRYSGKLATPLYAMKELPAGNQMQVLLLMARKSCGCCNGFSILPGCRWSCCTSCFRR